MFRDDTWERRDPVFWGLFFEFNISSAILNSSCVPMKVCTLLWLLYVIVSIFVICLCTFYSINETKAEPHYRICFINNFVQYISVRIWIRGTCSGDLFTSLTKSFHCCGLPFFFLVSIIMSNKLLQISPSHATIWQCTNVCISAEVGVVCFIMALLIMAKALSPKHHIDHEEYTYCIHNAYWILHTVRKMAHKNPRCLFCPFLFLFSSTVFAYSVTVLCK